MREIKHTHTDNTKKKLSELAKRQPRKIGNPCKLYLEQQLELARLGAMRAVGLKEKILELSAKVAELSDNYKSRFCSDDAPGKLLADGQ